MPKQQVKKYYISWNTYVMDKIKSCLVIREHIFHNLSVKQYTKSIDNASWKGKWI